MRKYVVTSDLHLTNKKSLYKRDENGVSELLKAQADFIHYLCDRHSRDCDGFLFLGDWTDYETLDPITLQYSTQLLSKINKSFDEAIFVEGNHCILDSKGVFTVLASYEGVFENVDVVYQEYFKETDDIDITGLPYISDYDIAEDLIRQFNDDAKRRDNFSLLLLHQPTVNSVMDNGFESINGIKLDAPDFDLVLLGDFHRHQQIADNAYYVGAPFDLKFGENEDRCYMIVTINDDKTFEIERLSNPYQIPLVDVTEENIGQISSRAICRVSDDMDEGLVNELQNKMLSVKRVRTKATKKEDAKSMSLTEAFSTDRDEAHLKKKLSRNLDRDEVEAAFQMYLEM